MLCSAMQEVRDSIGLLDAGVLGIRCPLCSTMQGLQEVCDSVGLLGADERGMPMLGPTM